MAKKISINSGMTALLSRDTDIFDQYEKITLNTGALYLTSEMQKKLNTIQAFINAGDVQVLDIHGKIVSLGSSDMEDTVVGSVPEQKHEGDAPYTGCFIVVENDFFIRPEEVSLYRGIEGLLAEKLFYPLSMNLKEFGQVCAEKIVAYPENARLCFGNMELDRGVVLQARESQAIWVEHRLTLLDTEIAKKVVEKNLRVECAHLVINESSFELIQSLCKFKKLTILPDGHAHIEGEIFSSVSPKIHGNKMYFPKNLTIRPEDLEDLAEISSLIVEKQVRLPREAAEIFGRIGKAKDVLVYEGHLLNINGSDKMSHEFFQSALEAGIRYTINVNGSLKLMEDVTAEDIDAVAALYYNGAVVVPGAAKAALQVKVRAGNGMMKSQDDELAKKMLKEMNGEAGEDSNDTTRINVGAYILL